MRWVGEDELDRVAETRWMCYAHSRQELPRYRENVRADRARAAEFLLAEEHSAPLGTVTSLPMTMWIRGAPISCQGVAYVGTIKTARRRGADSGVASALMHETLRMARERQYIVTALMPFRVSFYEHFGYGVVERRAEWTLPLSILPGGDFKGWRFEQPQDRAAKAQQWQATVEAGQCDIERPAARWEHASEEEGMVFVDRPRPDGPVRASLFAIQETMGDKRIAKVTEWSAESPAAFSGLLRFLGTLRDQYSAAAIAVPMDWPIHRILREAQMPHRPVEHAAAELRVSTRMQLRILDHRRYLESLRIPPTVAGRVNVSVLETEGTISKFSIQVEGGKARISSDGAADFECSDREWAAIATGDLPASQAVRLGLAKEMNAGAAETLDAFFAGPPPFCRESF
jgi:predicted acetyltransferase